VQTNKQTQTQTQTQQKLNDLTVSVKHLTLPSDISFVRCWEGEIWVCCVASQSTNGVPSVQIYKSNGKLIRTWQPNFFANGKIKKKNQRNKMKKQREINRKEKERAKM